LIWRHNHMLYQSSEERIIIKKTIILYVFLHAYRPPLWSSSQSSWLQIQTSGFDFRHYQIFWEVVGLERGPLSLVV
jgi:hypothetical protein